MSYARSEDDVLSTIENGSRTSGNVPSANEWQEVKSNIRFLYITKALPLKEVVRCMAKDYGFKASARMYKTRLTSWGYLKNITNRDWQAAAILADDRKKIGKKTARFTIHGRTITLQEFQRHLKKRGMSEQEFLQKARTSGVAPSDSIRANSPESGHINSAPSDTAFSGAKFSGTTVGDTRLQLRSESASGEESTSTGPSAPTGALICTPTSSQQSKRLQLSHNQHNAAYKHANAFVAPEKAPPAETMLNELPVAAQMPNLLTLNQSNRLTEHPAGDKSFAADPEQCDHLQQDMGFMIVQTLKPEALTAFPEMRDVESWQFVSRPDSSAEQKICPTCQSPSRMHPPHSAEWIMNPSAEHEQKISYQALDLNVSLASKLDDPSTFQACCFGACIYGGQEKYDLLAKSLQRADQFFAKMLREDNEFVLLSVLITLTILHSHDQGPMSASIIRSAYCVACDLLGPGNPMSLCLEWLTAAAGKKLKDEGRVNTAMLRAVYENMQHIYGKTHYNSIAAFYCLSFNLIRDKQFAEAENNLGQLYQICTTKLGPDNIQTIAVLNAMARSQSRQGKNNDAITTYRKSLASHPLGPNHPYRLETMRRLALSYKKVGNIQMVEKLYWAVLRGRIKTLSRTHTFTESARLDLERVLKDAGKWDEQGQMRERVESLYKDDSTALVSDIERF